MLGAMLWILDIEIHCICAHVGPIYKYCYRFDRTHGLVAILIFSLNRIEVKCSHLVSSYRIMRGPRGGADQRYKTIVTEVDQFSS